MTRPPRLDPPGTWHHVMNRGARRRTVFHDDRDRRHFIDLLSQLEHRFEVEVHLFCLVGNHYHLLVRSRSGRLSDAMKFVGEQFTRRSNTRHGNDGSIFRGRFHSRVVDADRHHRWLFRYIHANARDAGWTGPLRAYPWSSLGTMLAATPSARPHPWVRTDYFTDLFGADRSRMRRVANGEDASTFAAPVHPLETAALVEQAHLTSTAVDRELMTVVRSVVIDCLATSVAALDRATSGSRSDARMAAALLAVDAAHLPTSVVAADLGLASASACRVLVRRARHQRATNAAFAAAMVHAEGLFRDRHQRRAA